jgi:hypothetical protein
VRLLAESPRERCIAISDGKQELALLAVPLYITRLKVHEAHLFDFL